MGRWTAKDFEGNAFVCGDAVYESEKDTFRGYAIDRLAYYEELEEQGRLVVLTPHGDLIDRDKVFERYKHDPEKPEICDGAQDLDWLIQCLSEAPVIVPINS